MRALEGPTKNEKEFCVSLRETRGSEAAFSHALDQTRASYPKHKYQETPLRILHLHKKFLQLQPRKLFRNQSSQAAPLASFNVWRQPREQA